MPICNWICPATLRCCRSCQGESDEGNDAPDDPGDGPLLPQADAGAVVAGEEVHFAARCDEVPQADRQEYLLMREWLSACLEPSMFVSMPFLDDGHKKALFAQVLAVNPVVKTVEMLKEAGQSTVIQNCCAGLRHMGSGELRSRRTRRPCRGVYHVRANRCGFHQGFGRNAR